jgi:hypothetical protein
MWGNPGLLNLDRMEPLLKRFRVLLVGGVFYGDGVVTLADFTALLALVLDLL